MLASSAKKKGKILEAFVTERLKQSGLDIRATRTPGSGNGHIKGDIDSDLGILWECKNQAKPKILEWFKEATKDGLGYQKPVVVWHPPNVPLEESLVILEWCFFEELLKRSREPVMKTPDRTVLWKLENLKKAVNDLMKEL